MKRSRSPSYRDRSPRKYRRSHSPPSRRDQDDYRSRRSQRDDWNRKSYREDRRDRYESPKREEKDDKMIEQKEDTSELIPQKPQNLSVLHTHAQPQPVSIEEILKKKEEKEKQEQRPVFVSKKERKNRTKERQKAMEEKRRQIEEMRKNRQQLTQNLQNQMNEKRAMEQDPYEQIQKERGKEIEEIKNAYLGIKKEKKKVIKPSEKFKFSFDWSEEDDTSRDANELYNNPHEAQLLFGSGRRAGIESTEGKSLYDKIREERAKEMNLKISKKKRRTYDLVEDVKHWTEKTLEEMTERDWRILREDFEITTKGGNVPHPIRSWEDSGLPKPILDAIAEAGYTKPTPIQMQCIPVAIANRDIIGLAETGSGKTAAFVIPMLCYIMKLPPMNQFNALDGPYALVLAPTRELALQIEEETKKLAKYTGLRVRSMVGGVSMDKQAFSLREGCEILVATPGRLVDALDSRIIVLNQCNYVVLDEADRMINLGFEEQVNEILEAMPTTNKKPDDEEKEEKDRIYRQTIMFSATMPESIERLATKFLRRRVVVQVGEVGKAVSTIEQRVIWCKPDEKPKLLGEVLNKEYGKFLIFVNKKRECDGVAKICAKFGYRATTLHGGRSQDFRENALEGFRTGRFDIMVATDVAGRGIDVPDVTHVINYDMPKDIDGYTHRIGRTGRAGKSGVAISFLTPDETGIMYDLKQMLIRTKNRVPPELLNNEHAMVKPGTTQVKQLPRHKQIIFK